MQRKEIETLASRIRRCRKCRLWKGRKNAVPGEGPCPAKIMLIGQAPGRNEDASGRPFVGMAGKFLDRMLAKNRIKRRKVFITSVVKCFPPGNRLPKKEEIHACNTYLESQIKHVKPKLVVLLGNVAIRTVLGPDAIRLDIAHGKPVERDGILFLPTYHPAAAMRFPEIRRRMSGDFSRLRLELEN